MPNMVADGFLDQAFFVNAVANKPTNPDYRLGNAVGSAIGAAAITGAFTCTVATAAYDIGLVQLMMKRLVDMGYTCSLSGTTLTVNW